MKLRKIKDRPGRRVFFKEKEILEGDVIDVDDQKLVAALLRRGDFEEMKSESAPKKKAKEE